jgi:hypothetical protein
LLPPSMNSMLLLSLLGNNNSLNNNNNPVLTAVVTGELATMFSQKYPKLFNSPTKRFLVNTLLFMTAHNLLSQRNQRGR